MTADFRVVIIGGGIGGLCLAQGLKKAGISVAVYERNPNPTDWLQGYRIHMNPVGSRALYECLPTTLWEAFLTTIGKSSEGFGFLNEQLKELAVIAENTLTQTEDDPTQAHYPVSRIALRHLLLAGLEDVVHFNKTFVRYERITPGKVTAFFEDGTSVSGEVLIGADGANSRVCKQYLPASERVETGAIAIGGKLPLTPENRAWLPPQLSSRMNIAWPSSRAILFSAVFDPIQYSEETLSQTKTKIKLLGLDPQLLLDNQESYILWAYITQAGQYPSWTSNLEGKALQSLVAYQIKDWHPQLQQMVLEANPESLTKLPLKASLPIAPWPSSNVTVLGDAIHSMTPVLGLGANMALRDASLLSSKLQKVQREELSLVAAIGEYEASMRKYGFGAVRASVKYTRLAISNNYFSREAARTWFQICEAIPLLKRTTLENKFTEYMHN